MFLSVWKRFSVNMNIIWAPAHLARRFLATKRPKLVCFFVKRHGNSIFGGQDGLITPTISFKVVGNGISECL